MLSKSTLVNKTTQIVVAAEVKSQVETTYNSLSTVIRELWLRSWAEVIWQMVHLEFMSISKIRISRRGRLMDRLSETAPVAIENLSRVAVEEAIAQLSIRSSQQHRSRSNI